MATKKIKWFQKDGTLLHPETEWSMITDRPTTIGDECDCLIYFNNTKPASKYGGTWEELPQGRFLESAGSGGSAGINRDAGLPNITGTLSCRSSSGAEGILFVGGGAFWKNDSAVGTPDLNWQRAEAQYGHTRVYFDASKSNSIYKDGVTTVQPKSITAHIWRRVS